MVRLVWRLANKPPDLPASLPDWQVVAARISHWSLYVLLIAMPITGWLMSSASAYSVSWFNLFQLPDLVSPDGELKETFESIHKTLALMLFIVASIHVLAAVKHAVIDRDAILRRIASVPSVVVFILIIVVGVIALGGAAKSSAMDLSDLESGQSGNADDGNVTDGGLPLWNIDYNSSFIKFTGVQAGATFDGMWPSWRADIQFSASDLTASVFDVIVNTAAVETYDDDRNTTLADPEWFDSGRYPEARFTTNTFSTNNDGSFSAAGELVIKDRSTPVTLRFTVIENDKQRVLAGSATLDRLALGVGTGEWIDTTWIGKNVSVDVRVVASIAQE
jgi:cytochrome b561